MTEAGSSKRRFPRATEVLAALLLLAAAGLLLRVGYRHYMRTMYPMAYTELVEACAAEYGFDPSLVYALIRTESDFNPDACSSADARGLMQMTDETFEWRSAGPAVPICFPPISCMTRRSAPLRRLCLIPDAGKIHAYSHPVGRVQCRHGQGGPMAEGSPLFR